MYIEEKLENNVEKLPRLMRALGRNIERLLDIIFPGSPSEIMWRQKDALELVLRSTQAEPLHDHTIIASFAYRDPLIRALIWDLKYRGNKDAVRLCGKILFDALAEELADRKLFTDGRKAILIPIPLSKKREQERGFNQAMLLARDLARYDMQNFFIAREDVLKKIKETAPQTELSREKRLRNLHGAFVVWKPEAVRGRTVVLIDDVTTTGATIREARRALRAAGAREVLAFTIAH